MSFTKMLSLSWTALNGTTEARVQMGLPEEEIDDGLPLEEEQEEFLMPLA